VPAIAYIDESGKLWNHQDPIALGGVVFRTPPRNVLLRNALEAACPGVPWPHHAAQQSHPSYLALAAGLERTGPHAPSNAAVEAGRCMEAAGLLAPHQGADIWRLKVSALLALDAWLDLHHPALKRELDQHVRAHRAAADHVLSGLASQAFAFAVWSPAGHSGGAAAYMNLASALGRRASAVWGANRITVAARYPKVTSVDLSAALGGLVSVISYDEHAPAGMILADRIMYRLRQVLRTGQRGWPAVLGSWANDLPLATLPPDGTRVAPLIGAGGPLRDAVDAVAQQVDDGQLAVRAVGLALSALRPVWVADQAEAWFDTHSHLVPSALKSTGGWA
jgi:hypothetical protein